MRVRRWLALCALLAGGVAAGGAAEPQSALPPSGLAAVLPVPARAADPELLARATRHFASPPTERRVGGYRFLTDTGDLARIERWSALLAALEPAWSERYGTAPIGEPAETIVLFEQLASFRELQLGEPGLGALEANGFTHAGVVALASGELDESELEATLQHELAHLLTRRAIGPALPAWLAEGIAEEFGLAPFAGDRLDFASVRGSVRRDGNRFELRAGYALLDRLRRRVASGDVPSLASIAAVHELEFSSGDAGLDRYGAAFGWVRFLLAEPALARGFRAFLAAVARGEAPTLDRLERELGGPLAALEGPYAAWVESESDRILRAAGVPRVPRVLAPAPLREIAPAELPPRP